MYIIGLAVSPNTTINAAAAAALDKIAAPAAAPTSRARRTSDDKARELEISGVVSGKNVLITGGAAGLGHAFFNHFLQFGANVSVS